MKALDFIGLDTKYQDVRGIVRDHIYLDSAATTLSLQAGHDCRQELLRHYANLHSSSSAPARICTEKFEQARREILGYFGFDFAQYMPIFLGSGATAGINYFARFMARRRPECQQVLVSLMEHHSNDLPHRQFADKVYHVDLQRGDDYKSGHLDLAHLASLLQAGEVRYVAVSHVSNVTGVVNPIGKVCHLAHRHRVPVLVDCSQSVAHLADFSDIADADAIVFSGHKTYAPGTPGVLIIKRSLLDDDAILEYGGGIVDDVTTTDYQLSSNFDDRFQAGTPDILGVVQIGKTLSKLKEHGLQTLLDHEIDLLDYGIKQLSVFKGRLVIYSSTNKDVERVGIISFNILGIHYSLVAKILSDFFCISVRSGCFCAHPYVRALIKESLVTAEIEDQYLEDEDNFRGMVRVSFGAYSCRSHVDSLVNAISSIISNVDFYLQYYQQQYAETKVGESSCV